MLLNEIAGRPEVKLDIDNKAYVVHDSSGAEVSRHPFQHVWDSSPAKRAAEAEARELKIQFGRDQDARSRQAIEQKPLSDLEKEYIDLQRKWQRYYDSMYSKDPSKRLPDIDAATNQVYSDQMDKWMQRMEQLGQVVRKSIINGTHKSLSA